MNFDISKLRGTGIAIVTPFDANENVDYQSLEKLINHLINGGVEYLVVQGTTGESVTLTKKEKREVLDFVIEKTAKRVPVVVGIGGNNTKQVLEDFDAFDLTNVDAILSVSPSYNKPTQEGIYQHFKKIAERSPKPIILYNVPGRTSSNMLASTTLRLAKEFKNVVAVKEASGDIGQIMAIIKDRPEGFLVISGDDAITLPIIACGGDGVISVIGNVFPREFSDMVRLCLQGAFAKAQVNHYKLLSFVDLLFKEGNPGGAKAALKILGITGDTMRLPLVNVSDSHFETIKQAVKKIVG